MNGTSYALRKVVHNKPIVREVDVVRQREMWQWVWMSLVLVLVLLVTVWLQLGLLGQRGYGMEALQQQLEAEQQRARLLQLKIDELGSLERIHAVATTRLRMVAPGPNDAIVIQRAVAPERPPSSVVAAR